MSIRVVALALVALAVAGCGAAARVSDRIGGRTLSYFLGTTLAAAIVGLCVARVMPFTAVPALASDRVSLGFVVETERQVEAHLGEHLQKLPAADARSRAVVTQMQADEARQAITNTKPTEAELEGARATLALAERDLNKTVVRAPCDGRITALDIAAGEFAATGHPLFTIIDTEHWYAIGNFRETDLAGMAPGQRATVYVMAQPSRALRGQVDSLGWGVASDVSATIGGLPHVERTLNWVRIAARFPVRILLDAPPDDLMRFGATAVVVIDK